MKFSDFALVESLLKAIDRVGYTVPTPIQENAIPPVAQGRDVLGCAQTGTGKTAAFALPILQRLLTSPRKDRRHNPRVLVLAPTRELAAQVGESFQTYGRYTNIKTVTIFGGVSQRPQELELMQGPDVLVATPGRLLDLLGQRLLSLSGVEIFVLDEADRMLDMGFIVDIRKVVRLLPEQRQSLFFSATLPADIRELADSILGPDPVSISVSPPSSTVEQIQQNVCFVEREQKVSLLLHFLRQQAVGRALVFTRTKHGADKVVKMLARAGVEAKAIHGNKSQGARTRALHDFKTGESSVLVATDIAARGIDVDDITHVFNFDIPNEPETYVHRIGRTGRAGCSGISVAFCSEEERPLLRDVERFIKLHINRLSGYPHKTPLDEPPMTDLEPRPKRAITSRPGNGRPYPSAGPDRQQRGFGERGERKRGFRDGRGGPPRTSAGSERRDSPPKPQAPRGRDDTHSRRQGPNSSRPRRPQSSTNNPS